MLTGSFSLLAAEVDAADGAQQYLFGETTLDKEIQSGKGTVADKKRIAVRTRCPAGQVRFLVQHRHTLIGGSRMSRSMLAATSVGGHSTALKV
jgi:hypothetical protein